MTDNEVLTYINTNTKSCALWHWSQIIGVLRIIVSTMAGERCMSTHMKNYLTIASARNVTLSAAVHNKLNVYYDLLQGLTTIYTRQRELSPPPPPHTPPVTSLLW